MGYYLEEHPNATTAQYGWPRTRVSGVVGVHTTESGVVPAGADPGAENTAGFISRRSDHGSYHILADWDTIVPLTRPTFAAWADTTNNVHALSVSGAMNAARWRDLSPERAAGIVRNMGIAAAMLVRDAIAHGVLDEIVPARRITAQQAIDGTAKGFYGHGETNPGTRYDPGTNFDWDLFLASYAAAVGCGSDINYQSLTITPLEDTLSAAEVKQIVDAIYDAHDKINTHTTGTASNVTKHIDVKSEEDRLFLQREVNPRFDQAINENRAEESATREAIAALEPAQIADLIPKEIAQGVIDALGRKLVADNG